jgi:hypothetical protein
MPVERDRGNAGGLVVVGIILITVGLPFFLLGASDGYSVWEERRRFLAVAREASATVVSIRTSSGGGGGRSSSRSYATVPTVRFVDASGREWTGEMNMSVARTWRQGDRLTVLYDPAKPDIVWDGPRSMTNAYVSTGIAFALLLLGGALVFLYGRNPAHG